MGEHDKRDSDFGEENFTPPVVAGKPRRRIARFLGMVTTERTRSTETDRALRFLRGHFRSLGDDWEGMTDSLILENAATLYAQLIILCSLRGGRCIIKMPKSLDDEWQGKNPDNQVIWPGMLIDLRPSDDEDDSGDDDWHRPDDDPPIRPRPSGNRVAEYP